MRRTLQGTSRQEIEVYNFIQRCLPGIRVLKNDRTVLKGKELDIYVPSLKLAIEFNGLFYHNSSKRADPFYHLQKSVNCERKGIRLIQIMSDEWEQKKALVLDLIRHSIGAYEHLDASQCKLELMNEKEGKAFFNGNHLLGDDKRSEFYIGLSFDRSILFCAGFKKEKNNLIMTRFGDRKGYHVKNGLQTVISYIQEEYKVPVTTSIDRRLYSANELKLIGFREVQPTNPSVTITKDFKKRIPIENMKRFNESELEKKGYYKVYDCGERRFIKE